MSSETPEPWLAALEAALVQLAPAPAGLDRDQLLFRAGQASARRQHWLWPGVSAAMTALAALLGVLLLIRPEPPTVERVVVVHVPQPAPPAPEPPRETPPEPPPAVPLVVAVSRGPGSADYLRLREQLVRWGPDALPAPSGLAADQPPRPLTPAPTVEDLLGLPPRASRWPGWFGRPDARDPGDSL